MGWYRLIGQIISVVGWPVMRLIMWRSKRSYLFLQHNNEVLVLKTWLGIKSEWRLPGGGNKKNEDPKQALIRELYEETKIKIDPANISKFKQNPHESNWRYCYLLYGAKLDQKPKININKLEIIDAKWVKKEKLANLPCSEELKKALKTV